MLLEPVGVTPCLFAPPFRARALPSAAVVWERVGAGLWPAFSGVLIVEAIKQVYDEVRVVVKKPAFVPLPSLPGLSPVGRRVVHESRAIERTFCSFQVAEGSLIKSCKS